MVFDPGAGEPVEWFVCFSRQSATWWLKWMPGRFKHVRAFGQVASINTWIFLDPSLDRTVLKVARGDAAAALIDAWSVESDVIRMPIAYQGVRWPVFGWCVPQIRHVVGIRGSALRPDALFADCLRQKGAAVITHGKYQPSKLSASAA